MSPREIDLALFRQRLEEEKNRLLAGVRNLEERTARRGNFATDKEIGQDFDEHYGDAAAENVERQTDLAHFSNVHDLLRKIEVALHKLESGNYGICDRCGQAIDYARLKALPYASLCFKCQGMMEP